ncbi:hypothetical protein Curi_c23280 [Gottschalkia acidurici 9a]|uniref:DUF4083 domain-containing protein n=1 Tax=Gottschalkia acidurici (strain ATCC 7906 / DSM 604 / BCRC 14475 / CIP 104303 / KCTC 5404 / NCIMB 10678 / 9a) TaxID=1128398 RepID=K0B367_GOTA9|nr:hypothetical protein [Gottschalkia acidurici]AFS79330.1 hypothetical protein Curi_c23280 [Gottschalkia acidurici 9a]
MQVNIFPDLHILILQIVNILIAFAIPALICVCIYILVKNLNKKDKAIEELNKRIKDLEDIINKN